MLTCKVVNIFEDESLWLVVFDELQAMQKKNSARVEDSLINSRNTEGLARVASDVDVQIVFVISGSPAKRHVLVKLFRLEVGLDYLSRPRIDLAGEHMVHVKPHAFQCSNRGL